MSSTDPGTSSGDAVDEARQRRDDLEQDAASGADGLAQATEGKQSGVNVEPGDTADGEQADPSSDRP